MSRQRTGRELSGHSTRDLHASGQFCRIDNVVGGDVTGSDGCASRSEVPSGCVANASKSVACQIGKGTRVDFDVVGLVLGQIGAGVDADGAAVDGDFVTADCKTFCHSAIGFVKRDVASAFGDLLAGCQDQVGSQAQTLSAVCGRQGACSGGGSVNGYAVGCAGCACVASGVCCFGTQDVDAICQRGSCVAEHTLCALSGVA